MKTPIDRALDAQFVKRWSLVCTTAESNVASHSYNVAVLAMAIWKEMRNNVEYGIKEVCYYAMLHDIDEVFTGDMPTPTKNAIRDKGVEPNELFVGQSTEDRPPAKIALVIKLADLIDNYIFIYRHGSGVRAWEAASEVAGRMRAAIDAAPGDVARAAQAVLSYVENRRSNTDEERKRIAQDAERGRQAANLGGPPIAYLVGGVARDKSRIP